MLRVVVRHLSRLGLIAVLAACSSGGSRPGRTPEVRAAVPATPVAREAPPGAEAAPEPPLEAQAPSIPAGRIRFARVDPHRAALFLAQVLRFDVIAVGGTDEPITIGIQSATADGALRELAGASSLSLEAAGRGFWLGPPESVAGGGRSKLRGGRRLDVSFHRADVAYVVQLLEDVDRISLDGSLTGTVSMSIREAPARELLGSLARLAGREARMRGRTVTLSGAGVLPPTPEGGSEPCRQRAERSVHAVLLPCVPPAALEVCGTAVLADRGLALVRRRGAGPGSGLAAAVRRGDWVGEPEVRVASIDTDGLTLEDGTRLPLGGSAAPACTEATLQAFSPVSSSHSRGNFGTRSSASRTRPGPTATVERAAWRSRATCATGSSLPRSRAATAGSSRGSRWTAASRSSRSPPWRRWRSACASSRRRAIRSGCEAPRCAGTRRRVAPSSSSWTRVPESCSGGARSFACCGLP